MWSAVIVIELYGLKAVFLLDPSSVCFSCIILKSTRSI